MKFSKDSENSIFENCNIKHDSMHFCSSIAYYYNSLR